jgi:hypothetical protein
MVGNEEERLSKGKYGVSVLPLLTGQELVLDDGKVRYIRNGMSTDMHGSLLTSIGKQLRVLRGFQLRSGYAPQAGVRYDGL